MRKIKYAFTLVELLGVIVILGVISLIAIPVVSNIMTDSRKEAFVNSVEGAFRAALYQMGMDNMDGINVTEYPISKLALSNYNLSGKFILDESNNLVAYYVKNDKYCAYGRSNNLNVESDCNLLDSSIPVIDEKKLILVSNTNSITVTLGKDIAYDLESNIIKIVINLYKEDQIVSSKEFNDINNYTFNNLVNDTLYEVELVTINGNKLENSLRKNIRTKLIDYPSYIVEPSNWSTSKTVTISYPNGFINEYSIDGGKTWLKYQNPIKLLDNCSIIARVSDGYNYITGSTQTISKIDNTIPNVSLTGSINSSTWTNSNVTLKANISPNTIPSGYKVEWYKDDIKINDINSNTYTINTSSLINSNYKVKVITGANNSTMSTDYKILIDKNMPSISISPNGGDYEVNTSIPINISISDKDSGIKEKKYAFSESNTITPTSYYDLTSNTVNTSLNGISKYLWINVLDNAGNRKTYTSNALNTLYKINYDLNGGTGIIESTTKLYNKDITLSNTIPKRTNYIFKGWSNTSTGTALYSAGSSYKINASITLYAVWELALVEETTTLSFPSTTTQNRSLSKELPGFNKIVSITVDNGNVNYTISGNTINVSVNGGKPTSKRECSNQYICEEYNACRTSCWDCSVSSTGTCCGCPGCWPDGTCCCTPETSCGWKDVCSYSNFYEYTVTIKYMKGS